MARFAKQDRVFALFYVSLGFVTFPKRAKGGPLLGPILLVSYWPLAPPGHLLLGSASERQRRPADLQILHKIVAARAAGER